MHNTTEVAYHASHEQFAPSELVKLAVMAEQCGFQAIHSSDHFHPWSKRQGNSGFSFSWLGAAMQATSLPFSVVCAPGQRYHPAIVAQAAATLAEMFPGRFGIELGSGEAINEMITGDGWPEKILRNKRLEQCAHIIRKLLAGDTVNFHGLVKVRHARLYSLPKEPPPIFGAALSLDTVTWCGTWAEGLLTTGSDAEDLGKKILYFRQMAGGDKPVYAQYSFSYHPDRRAAIDGAYDQWRSNLVGMDKLATLEKVEEFDREGEQITREEIEKNIPIYTDMAALQESGQAFAKAGANRVVLHNINRHQEGFIRDYQRYVEQLPRH